MEGPNFYELEPPAAPAAAAAANGEMAIFVHTHKLYLQPKRRDENITPRTLGWKSKKCLNY